MWPERMFVREDWSGCGTFEEGLTFPAWLARLQRAISPKCGIDGRSSGQCRQVGHVVCEEVQKDNETLVLWWTE
jgi:hypothetical protein